jgi:hypothetical protein
VSELKSLPNGRLLLDGLLMTRKRRQSGSKVDVEEANFETLLAGGRGCRGQEVPRMNRQLLSPPGSPPAASPYTPD